MIMAHFLDMKKAISHSGGVNRQKGKERYRNGH